ncbi:hypothetical protein APHMUC_0495 [Anaplasma phagocytophilum str. ApMUC09]|uniref:Uncharacterized protein n=1 Tax=Anaplasma phagocytophilum str. ApMUC09 TaxID=1359152 RepID=A0A0F3NAE1_ANAPH|nr:hypothetical protein APHMUC_0495 [Anaplasma phagocytophilum str. ApMUC09]
MNSQFGTHVAVEKCNFPIVYTQYTLRHLPTLFPQILPNRNSSIESWKAVKKVV